MTYDSEKALYPLKEEIIPLHALKITLYKTSPKHRFVCLYDDNISMGNWGSRARPCVVKMKSGPAFDMLFLLCLLKKHRENEWVDAAELCRIYFGDDVSCDVIHNYMESKLRGAFRKELKRTFGTEATGFLVRENNCYRLALAKENVEIDKSVFEFGVPQEGDEARKMRFKSLLSEGAIEIQFPVT